jgi:hypothetical protein
LFVIGGADIPSTELTFSVTQGFLTEAMARSVADAMHAPERLTPFNYELKRDANHDLSSHINRILASAADLIC